MEEHRNKAINLHAIQSQNISKFTGNISKNTSKFTSKTNQIRLGGCHGPSTSLSRPYRALGVPGPGHPPRGCAGFGGGLRPSWQLRVYHGALTCVHGCRCSTGSTGDEYQEKHHLSADFSGLSWLNGRVRFINKNLATHVTLSGYSGDITDVADFSTSHIVD